MVHPSCNVKHHVQMVFVVHDYHKALRWRSLCRVQSLHVHSVDLDCTAVHLMWL